MASELSVRQITPQTARRVTVGYGISVDSTATISVESPINAVGNFNIGHGDIQDDLIVNDTITITSDAFGDGSNITNLDASTTRQKVIAYQYVLDPLPFKA